ncbi:hypothetical protein ABK040_016110 [Willaertia magna]
MYKKEGFFATKEIKNKIFNLLLDYSGGSLFIHHIIPFISKNDLFLNFYLTCKKIATLIQQQITYNVILNIDLRNLLSLMNIYFEDKDKPIIVKDFLENKKINNWNINNECQRLDFCKTFPSILHFIDGLSIANDLLYRFDNFFNPTISFKDFRNLIKCIYEYTFLLNCNSVKYFTFYQTNRYMYGQTEASLDKFKTILVTDISNLFKKYNGNLSFNYCKAAAYTYQNLISAEQLADYILDFQQIISLNELNILTYDMQFLKSFNEHLIKIVNNNNYFSNLKKFKVLCNDSTDLVLLDNVINNIILNETKIVIKWENVNCNVAYYGGNFTKLYELLTKPNVYLNGDIKFENINMENLILENEGLVKKLDIIELLNSLHLDKVSSIKFNNCILFTTSSIEKQFNFKNIKLFECVNTTFKKFVDDKTIINFTKEILDNFKFQNLKIMKLENLNLNKIPISVNHTISNLIELSLAKNNISTIDNLNRNLQKNLFVNFSDNKIKDISILNIFRYISLENNPILQNNNIGIYNDKYFIIDTDDITFKKYFQSNFMELYLFNNMQFVKTLKKKNGNNCKAKVLSNSQAILSFLDLSKFNDKLYDTFYEKALNSLQSKSNLYKFYLNILYTEPEENSYSIKGIGSIVQVGIKSIQTNNDWLIININSNLINSNYIKEEISVWDKSNVDLEKLNYIEKNWKALTLKK